MPAQASAASGAPADLNRWYAARVTLHDGNRRVEGNAEQPARVTFRVGRG